MKQADKNQHILDEIVSAQAVIARSEESGHDRYVSIVGVLRATFAGMAGLGDFTTHRSCFDAETTEAIQKLIETIDQDTNPEPDPWFHPTCNDDLAEFE